MCGIIFLLFWNNSGPKNLETLFQFDLNQYTVKIFVVFRFFKIELLFIKEITEDFAW